MIKEENKELVFRAILAIVLLIVVLVIGIYFIISIKNNRNDEEEKKEEIPQIKENYDTTKINNYKIYNNLVYLSDGNEEIILESDDDNIYQYVIGKFGSIFNTRIPNYVIKEKAKYKNYEVIYEEDNIYYINRDNNAISDYYNNIEVIKIDNEYAYFILTKNDKYYILSLETDELKELDSEIKNISIDGVSDPNNITQMLNSKYLIVVNNDNKYGIIDYNGNIIIDFKYDYLSAYNNDNLFISKINNKYGIIDYNDKIIIDFKYDNIIYHKDLDNYSLFIKDKNLNVYYNDKEIVSNKIKYNHTTDVGIETNIYNDTLYLNIISSLEESDVQNYIINKNGIYQTTKGIYNPLYNSDKEIKYFYKLEKLDGQTKISFYDTDYNELYSMEVSFLYDDDNVILIDLINDTNICSISYENIYNPEKKNQIYYVDLFNSKQMKEIDAIYEYFDNGYGFTLNNNRELKIYKNKELISSYNNIDTYLGGYYFLTVDYNNTSDEITSIIKNIEFKKESK